MHQNLCIVKVVQQFGGRIYSWLYLSVFLLCPFLSRISSTMCVLVFPILIQRELLQVAEQMSREQRSILLGPQAATGPISGGAF